jgi:hypothetical protein
METSSLNFGGDLVQCLAPGDVPPLREGEQVGYANPPVRTHPVVWDFAAIDKPDEVLARHPEIFRRGLSGEGLAIWTQRHLTSGRK